jgi:hypothetical protein
MTVPGENELHAESILLVPLRWADTDSSPRDGQLTPSDAYADAGRHQVRGLAAIVVCDANDVGALLGLDHLGQFLVQLWAIVMTMHCDSVLHGRIQKFFFGICRNGDGAVFLAWIITAIHKHSGHLDLPWYDGSQHTSLFSSRCPF